MAASVARGGMRVLLGVAIIAALALSSTARASLIGTGPASYCDTTASQKFSRWGDSSYYASLLNGGFESYGGWTLSGGARVVSGNESFFVHSNLDKLSLSLPAGATATSPPMCISLLSSKMRFLAKGNAGSKIKVQIIYRGIFSQLLGIFDDGTMSPSGTWNAAPATSMLGGVLPLLTASVSFRFTAVGAAASIDDVYLDPWKGT